MLSTNQVNLSKCDFFLESETTSTVCIKHNVGNKKDLRIIRFLCKDFFCTVISQNTQTAQLTAHFLFSIFAKCVSHASVTGGEDRKTSWMIIYTYVLMQKWDM